MRSDVFIEGIKFVAATSSATTNSVAPKAFEILLVGFFTIYICTFHL